jgi:hypothetical protein
MVVLKRGFDLLTSRKALSVLFLIRQKGHMNTCFHWRTSAIAILSLAFSRAKR